MAISEHGALQPHVVLVPSPLKGHTIPFIILTKQLVGHGVWVTLVSSDKHIASQEQDKVNFVGLREGPSNFMEAISEVSDVRMAEMLSEWLRMAMEMPQKLKSDGHSQARAAPCCIISDMFGGWTQDVEKKFEIPNHVLFTSPAACAAMQLTIPKLFEEGILPFPSSHKGYVNIPGIPPLDFHDLPEYLIAEESSTKHKFYTRHT
ncbi:UDP-glycosyltransferase 86A1 [Physcomitrium patens]|uniref:Uncharacterized protein n=1 Tax=Physcomitrium patens TaxID=3218 RepID=A0A2K1IJ20_PHYPA|nr:hypothetical protein PHYPA_027961 [Physcomitrium patens]